MADDGMETETIVEYDWLEDGELVGIHTRLEFACSMECQMEGVVESETTVLKVLVDDWMETETIIRYDWLVDGELAGIIAQLEVACTIEDQMEGLVKE
jgi:hypothetical protein